jgi:hypothetical protein
VGPGERGEGRNRVVGLSESENVRARTLAETTGDLRTATAVEGEGTRGAASCDDDGQSADAGTVQPLRAHASKRQVKESDLLRLISFAAVRNGSDLDYEGADKFVCRGADLSMISVTKGLRTRNAFIRTRRQTSCGAEPFANPKPMIRTPYSDLRFSPERYKMSKRLTIETALENAGDPYISKYRLMKNRLLNVEYEHWAIVFLRETII